MAGHESFLPPVGSIPFPHFFVRLPEITIGSFPEGNSGLGPTFGTPARHRFLSLLSVVLVCFAGRGRLLILGTALFAARGRLLILGRSRCLSLLSVVLVKPRLVSFAGRGPLILGTARCAALCRQMPASVPWSFSCQTPVAVPARCRALLAVPPEAGF